jgi:hypothetical protein
LLGVDASRAHFVRSLAYRVFMTKPNTVLTILSGVCPICGRRFKHNLDAYYHFTKYTKCSGRLFEIFNASLGCGFVNVDLVHMMFPFNVVDVYRRYARRVVCSDGVDGRRVYVNVFDFDRCSLRSVDVAYFIDCGDWRVMRVVGDGDS